VLGSLKGGSIPHQWEGHGRDILTTALRRLDGYSPHRLVSVRTDTVNEYTLIACIQQTRVYHIEAENAEAAKEIVRGDHNFIEYDIIDTEVDDVTVED